MITVEYYQRISLVKEAQAFIREKLPNAGLAVDATTGNGHDTLFLARQAGRHGCVYGFDIQQIALESARARLKQAGMLEQSILFHASHELMMDYVPGKHIGKIDAIMFNLGYLPGNDKAITTNASSTVKALDVAIQLISAAGAISLIAYPGHPDGRRETEAVTNWCKQLDSTRFDIHIRLHSAHRVTPPCLFCIGRNS